MRIYTYVIEHDLGFAPNPFELVCSLAACKPQIRKYACKDDIILGTGSAERGRRGFLVYWMAVDEILTFDQYWDDPRFRLKRPVMNGSLSQRHGDNIYHRGPGDTFLQEDSFHSEENGALSVDNLRRDTGTTDRVLLGRKFSYWGGSGPKIPGDLGDFVHKTQGHKCRFENDRVAAMCAWLAKQPDRGLRGFPTDWKSYE